VKYRGGQNFTGFIINLILSAHKITEMPLSRPQLRYQRVVELYTNGDKTQQEIATELGVSLSTVEKYISKYRSNIPVEEVRPVGRPSLLNDTVRGTIASVLQRDSFATSKDITTAIRAQDTPAVSDRTVRRYLGCLDYRNSLPRVIPFITDAQKTRRIEWARAHIEFNWNRVFFSDETTIQLSANITRAWHKNDSRPNCKKTKYPVKVMFWSAISVSRKSPLLVVSGNLNASGYQELLAGGFLPWFRQQHIGRLTFQQDNAPAHTAKSTRDFFESHNVDVIPWPASSPDLNPIENIWGILKARVDRRKPQNKQELISFALEEWDGIAMDIVRRTIESMPNRIAEVIEKQGEKISY
jgi:transposase